MTNLFRDRRQAVRTTADIGRTLDLPVTIPVEVLDISAGGLLVKSAGPVDPERRCRLKVLLGHEPLVVSVMVRRCQPGAPGEGFRIAAEFTDLTPEADRTIQRFLERKGA